MLFILFFLLHSRAQEQFLIGLSFQVPIQQNTYARTFAKTQTNRDDSLFIGKHKMIVYLDDTILGNQATLFDFFEIDESEETQQMECYKNNLDQLQSSACTETSCQDFNQSKIRTGLRIHHTQIDSGHTYIVDNTALPCVNGTLFQVISPWITVSSHIKIEEFYYIMSEIMIVFMILFGSIQVIAIFVLYYKLRKLKKKIDGKNQTQMYRAFSQLMGPPMRDSGGSGKQFELIPVHEESYASYFSDQNQMTLN